MRADERRLLRYGQAVVLGARAFDRLLCLAEQYDRMLEDSFAVQEEVTECIVGAVAPHVDAAELLKARRRPGSLSAYELALRTRCADLASGPLGIRASGRQGVR